MAGPSVLVLNSLKVHKMDHVGVALERDCHTSLKFVPPGVMGLCQPMDVAVMKPSKTRCAGVTEFQAKVRSLMKLSLDAVYKFTNMYTL